MRRNFCRCSGFLLREFAISVKLIIMVLAPAGSMLALGIWKRSEDSDFLGSFANAWSSSFS